MIASTNSFLDKNVGTIVINKTLPTFDSHIITFKDSICYFAFASAVISAYPSCLQIEDIGGIMYFKVTLVESDIFYIIKYVCELTEYVQ